MLVRNPKTQTDVLLMLVLWHERQAHMLAIGGDEQAFLMQLHAMTL